MTLNINLKGVRIMFKKVFLIFVLFLTVAASSALTTVWLSARTVSAYSTSTNYALIMSAALDERLDKLESDLRQVRLDGIANTRSINQIYEIVGDLEDDRDFIWKMMVELHGKALNDKIFNMK